MDSVPDRHPGQLTLVLKADPPLEICYPPHILRQPTIQVDRYEQPIPPTSHLLKFLCQPPSLWRVRQTVRAYDDLVPRRRVLDLLRKAGVALCFLCRSIMVGDGSEGLGLARAFAPVHQVCFVVAQEELEGLGYGFLADARPAVEEDDGWAHGRWSVVGGVESVLKIEDSRWTGAFSELCNVAAGMCAVYERC